MKKIARAWVAILGVLLAASWSPAADESNQASMIKRVKERPVLEMQYGDWAALGDAPEITGCFAFYGAANEKSAFGVAYVHHNNTQYAAAFARGDFKRWFGDATGEPLYCVAKAQVEKAEPGMNHGLHYRIASCEALCDAVKLTKLVVNCRADFLARFDASHQEAAQWTAALLKDNKEVEEKDRAAELPKGVYQQPEVDYNRGWKAQGEMKFILGRGVNDMAFVSYDAEAKTVGVSFEDSIFCSYVEDLSPLSSRTPNIKEIGQTHLLNAVYSIKLPATLSSITIYGPDSAVEVPLRAR